MNKEMQSIRHSLANVLDGAPWYGRSVYSLLQEFDPETAFDKPGKESHSAADLLYHMLTWTAFAAAAVQGKPEEEIRGVAALNWRPIHPEEQTWEKGVAAFKETNQQLLALLNTKDDALLDKTVPAREYNFRFMLNGLVQHHIYHIGQIAYLHKLRPEEA